MLIVRARRGKETVGVSSHVTRKLQSGKKIKKQISRKLSAKSFQPFGQHFSKLFCRSFDGYFYRTK